MTQEKVLDFGLHILSGKRTILEQRSTVIGCLRIIDVFVHSEILRAVFFNLVALVQNFLHQVQVSLIRGIVGVHLTRCLQCLIRIVDVAQAHVCFEQAFVALRECRVQTQCELNVVERSFEVFDRDE